MRGLRGARLALAVAVVAGLLSFTRDAMNTAHHPGVDLQDGVGAGLRMLAGQDPYLAAPAQPAGPLLSPPLLLGYGLLGRLAPRHGHALYLVLQWLALLLSLHLLTRSERDDTGRALAWAGGLFVVAGLDAWALHVERGQCAIFIVLLVAAAHDLVQRGGTAREWAAGAVLGVAIAARPSLAAVLLAPLLLGYPRLCGGAVAGAGLGGLAALLAGGVAAWRSYLAAAALQAQHALGDPGAPLALRIEERPFVNTPVVFPDASAPAIWRLLTDRPLPGAALALLGAGVALAVGLWVLRHRRGSEARGSLFLAVGVIAVLTPLLLPAPRFSYEDVTWLVLLSLILGAHGRHGRAFYPAGPLLATGALIGLSGWVDERFLLAGELFVTAYLVITAALVLRERAAFRQLT